MNWDIDNIVNIVEYINNELLNGRTMKDIENNDFEVNERVISKRLVRKGYRKIDNGYHIPGESITEGIPKYNKDKNNGITKGIPRYNKSITKDIPQQNKSVELISNDNLIGDIDIKAIKELVGLIDPIKEVILKYNQSITNENVIDVTPIEININRNILNNKIKPVGFKVDEVVYEQWKNFTNKFTEIKNQDLIGMALIEFMDKYNTSDKNK